MAEFPSIRNVLATLFDVSVGLSDEAAKQILLRQMAVPAWRDEFRKELIDAFRDPATPWRELMFNCSYEVSEFDTRLDARTHAARLLWDVACPHEPLPEERER
jgi:hypothetical protein